MIIKIVTLTGDERMIDVEPSDKVLDTIYKLWLHQRYQNLALSQDIVCLLLSLRKKYQVALITNGTSAAQWEKIEKLDLRDYFDLILVSGDLPYEKPNKNIFFQACEYLNVDPKNCLMVGDKLETDIQGGLAAGLAGTVWIPLTTCYSLAKSDPQPDYIIKHVNDLRDVLNGDEESRWSFDHHQKPLMSKQFSRVFYLEEDSNSNASDGS